MLTRIWTCGHRLGNVRRLGHLRLENAPLTVVQTRASMELTWSKGVIVPVTSIRRQPFWRLLGRSSAGEGGLDD